MSTEYKGLMRALDRLAHYSKSSCIIESRPICAQDGLGCVRLYEIVKVSATGTVVLRVETHDGVIVDNYTSVPCNCDCLDEFSV